MTAPWRNRGLGLALAAAIYAIDQWVKHLVTGPLGLVREGDQFYVLPIFNVTLTHNFGVSLGFLKATSAEMRWGLVAMTGIIAAVVVGWLLRERKLGDIVPLGMILGGALGNIYDRVLYGHVIDYADLHFGNFRPFLVFNIADASISIGVVLILVRALFMREKPAPAQEGAQADQPAENSTNA